MRPSASKLRLLVLCTHFAREDVKWPAKDSGKYAAKGNALHALAEGASDAEAKVLALGEKDQADVRAWHASWLTSRWARIPWLHEVAFAYSPERDEGRELPSESHRDYSKLAADELAGTADLVLLDRETDSVTIADIKTGWQQDREAIEDHSQLRFLALAAARAYGVGTAYILLLDVDAVGVEDEPAELDTLQIGEIADALLERWRAIPGSDPTPGQHCAGLDCPALTVCPATQAIALQVTPAARAVLAAAPAEADEKKEAKRVETLAAVQGDFALVTTPESDAHALWLRDAVPVLEEYLAAVTRGVRAYADARGGIPCGEGKVWGLVNGERELISLDDQAGPEAVAFLERSGLGDALEEKITTSKDAITKVVKALLEAGGVPKRGALKAETDRVFGELRMMGAMRTVPAPKYTEHKPKSL